MGTALDKCFLGEAAQGHTILTRTGFAYQSKVLNLDIRKQEVDFLVEKGEVFRIGDALGGGPGFVAEAAVARALHAFRARAILPRLPYGIAPTVPLGAQQAAAWGLLASGSTCILTGRPGTGKTYLSAAFISALQAAGKTVTVAAPTGKAASVLASKLDGIKVQTIHRLLGLRPGEYAGTRTVDTDVLVVDEASMIGSGLMASLLLAINQDTQLILVGDPDQLPPVDAGRPFYDMVKWELLPLARLTDPQRQSLESGILQMAYAMANGQFFLPSKDVHVFNLPPERVLSEAVDLYCSDRVMTRFGLTNRLRQLLTLVPVKDEKFATTTTKFNEAVSHRLLPERKLPRSKFTFGDRLIFTVNNYDYGFVNGEMGMLEARGSGVTTITNDRDFTYQLPGYRLSEWAEWGYGLTIHRAQGSEADVVMLLLEPGASHMYTKNLVYTALTRAKSQVLLLGDVNLLRQAVQRQEVRHTALPELFRRPALTQQVVERHTPQALNLEPELQYLLADE